ncbi:hypothetical protein EV356DRAFT_517592 [Viridothelium virens]|uniref:BZIP domain-containing protein n=1 Tax=Viridothelium virens TaxID=1048519 RepID=A0A6A6H448_VIRVR|nr:hypothetical protein EV356DRAFT_517592 [Viridothelium virens]
MAAVASRSSNNSPHLNSRMSSPKDTKRNIVKTEENQRKESPLHNSQEAKQPSPPRTDPATTGAQAVESKGDSNSKPATTNTEPLAPPPKPTQNNPSDTPDYFGGSTSNGNGSHFSLEPNPFEQSFGNTSTETPGKTLLPPVTSLTSPASLLPGNTPGWQGSLRSGPLSPAMLTGPTAANDYFGDHFRGGFPTPNESSLRTGLTPGGGGSMFPAPSPNSQALFNSLQSGGATPSTLDFHRTAMNARAASHANNNYSNNTSNGQTSQPQEQGNNTATETKYQPPTSQPQGQSDIFGQGDANDAANGLYMLAQANGGRNNNQQFAMPQQPTQNMSHMGNSMPQDTTPQSATRGNKSSIGSISTARGMSEGAEFSDSGNSEQNKPAPKSKGKKGSAGKNQSNGRRKADETPSKQPANKKQKGNNGIANMEPDLDDSDDGGSVKLEGENGRKMTDEEKRKNFLERNRVAALKCRQRKKQWLANLQAKVEIFSTENDALSATVTQLREEIVNLKTLLLAHKDCPVAQAQGLTGMAMNSFNGDVAAHHANPYGMAMQNAGLQQGMQGGQGGMQGQQGMQRRLDPALRSHDEM